MTTHCTFPLVPVKKGGKGRRDPFKEFEDGREERKKRRNVLKRKLHSKGEGGEKKVQTLISERGTETDLLECLGG